MSDNTFELDDLTDAEEAQVVVEFHNEGGGPPSELEVWADEQLAKGTGENNPVIFDIETGPRPLEEIECFYTPPDPLPPWDESMVKYGNAKKEELREQKRQESKAAYQAQLDNESVARAAHKDEWLARAALSPVTGRVLLIGLLLDEESTFFIGGPIEAENLQTFWRITDDLLANKRPLIGHNSNGFDLPFLVRRSWCLGVPVPREVRQGRYWNPLFRDTMEQWNCGAREYVKLDVLGQFFGVGQKTEGVEGKYFAKLWFGQMPVEQWGTPDQQRAKAIEYNGQDLRLTAAVAAKMGMM